MKGLYAALAVLQLGVLLPANVYCGTQNTWSYGVAAVNIAGGLVAVYLTVTAP